MRNARPLLLAGSFALVATLFVMRMTPAGAGALEPNIALLPPAGNVVVGHQFTIVAYAEHLEGVGAYELELRFDSEAVAFVSFDDGDVLGGTGRTVFCLAGPSTSEDVMYGCASTGPAPGASGEGVLAAFTFLALETGATEIRLREAALADVNGDPLDVDFEGTSIDIKNARGIIDLGGTTTITPTAEAKATSDTTSTVEPRETIAFTETAAAETETAAPTEEPTEDAETSTPAPTSTGASATQTPGVDTPTVAAETATAEPEATVEVTETPAEHQTPTPEATETVAVATETPAPEDTPTPEEPKPTETVTPDLTKPSETPESTGTPGFVPPTATPGGQTATTTSVATATNTAVTTTQTPAATTGTPDSVITPATTSSQSAAATVAATLTETNEVLGVTNDRPAGIVLPVTGSGGDDVASGAMRYATILIAIGIVVTIALVAAVRRRA